TRPAGPIVGQWQATGTHGAVAAGGAEAVAAGLTVLRDGGNAVDAAVTTILAQTVTDANQFCFGGEVPIVVYDARRKVVEVLAGHVTRIDEPATIRYRGYTVAKCGPWSQGPMLLEALQLLEGFNLAAMGLNHPDTIHVTVEALKLAFADRDVYYADPLFED